MAKDNAENMNITIKLKKKTPLVVTLYVDRKCPKMMITLLKCDEHSKISTKVMYTTLLYILK